MVPEQIEHDVFINAPPERVWDVITEAAHVQKWFAFDGATIDLRPGGDIVMHWKEHGTFHARIEQVDPPSRFSYRGARLPDEQVGKGNTTLVAFTLAREGNGTRLRVVESGFRDLAIPEAEQAEQARGNVEGWSGGFAALQEYMQELAAAPR